MFANWGPVPSATASEPASVPVRPVTIQWGWLASVQERGDTTLLDHPKKTESDQHQHQQQPGARSQEPLTMREASRLTRLLKEQKQ